MSNINNFIQPHDLWVIQKLRDLLITGKNCEEVEFCIQVRPLKSLEEPSAREQETTILRLQQLSTIKIIDNQKTRSTYGWDYLFYIQVLQPKFSAFYSQMIKEKVDALKLNDNKNNSLELDIPFSRQVELLKSMVEKNTEKRALIDTIKEEMKREGMETENLGSVRSGFQVEPICSIEGKKGFFQHSKREKRILIGICTSRHFKLLKFFIEPTFKAPRTVDAAYDAIKIPRDQKDHRLISELTGNARKLKIIRQTIKELKRGKKLPRVTFDVDGRQIRLNIN